MSATFDDERPERLRLLIDRACLLAAMKRRPGDPMPEVRIRVDDLLRLADMAETAGVGLELSRLPST